MKRAIKFSLVVMGLLLVVLLTTRPDEADYKEWLAKKYDISCVSSFECKRGEEVIEWNSRIVNSFPIYYHVTEDNYTAGNEMVRIRAFGILNRFIDYSEIVVFDRNRSGDGVIGCVNRVIRDRFFCGVQSG